MINLLTKYAINMLGLNLLGRDFVGIEKEPEFIDIALNRSWRGG